MTWTIWVAGKQAPSKEHKDLASAIDEVHRLATQPECKGKDIFLFKIEGVYRPTYNWTDYTDDLTAQHVVMRLEK